MCTVIISKLFQNIHISWIKWAVFKMPGFDNLVAIGVLEIQQIKR